MHSEYTLELPPLLTMAVNVGFAVLLLYLCVTVERFRPSGWRRSVIYGVIFGILAIATMSVPVTMAPGFLLDARLPLIMLASPFGGGLASPIAGIMSAGYRLLIGGGGAEAGAVGSLLAGVIGLIVSRWSWIGSRWTYAGFVVLGVFSALHIYLVLWLFSDHDVAGQIISGQWGSILVSSILFNVTIGAAVHFAQTQVREHQKFTQSQRLIDATFETSKDLLVLLDLEGNVIRVSASYAGLVGYAAEELVGRNILEFIRKDEIPLAQERLAASRAGRFEEGSSEYHIRLHDGSWRLIETAPVLIQDQSGEPFALFSTARDQTERRAAEEALATSEARLRSIIDNAPISILLKDTEGRFLFAGEEFQRRYGINPADVKGKTDYDLHPKEFADENTAMDREVLATGKPVTREQKVVFADGDDHTVIITKFPILEKSGEVSALGSVSVDVTEQRKIEEQLRQAQKMEAVGQLTGGIAHDFNNIMMIAQGNLELLQQRLDLDERSAAMLDRILSALESGSALTNQLLAFSRKQYLAPQILNVGAVIAGMDGLITRSLGERIEVSISTVDDLWSTKLDAAQLESAVLNLALNARDAMPEGGRLLMTSSNVVLTAAQSEKLGVEPGEYVELRVEDTGAGIPPEAMDHIFEPFFTTKERGKGSGLGLSMVYGFVRQSGGGILVESELEQGTAVSIYLPRWVVGLEAETDSEQAGQRAVDNGGLILVVEDDVAVLEYVKSVLERLGYEVVTAPCADEAISLVKSNEGFDLVLSDILLGGGLTGLEMAEQLREMNPQLRFIFMTGYLDPDADAGALSKDDVMLLKKPFRKAELDAAVSAALNAQRAPE